MRLLSVLAGCSLAAVAIGATVPACALPLLSNTVGQGEGAISGTLNVPDCWSGKFDLAPDFFAGVPYKQTLDLRIQHGGDFETFSDGVSILIDDVNEIRPADDGSKPGLYGAPLAVSLPPAVVPPGVPITPSLHPAHIHMALYLQHSCRTQNVALYAVEQVQLNADGSCSAPLDPLSCTQVQPVSDGGASPALDAGAPATLPIGRSTITFTSLFDGNPDEEIAAKRLTAASFHVFLADPRDICPGGSGPPPRCRGELETGPEGFSFYFQRGKPAQPFP